MLATIERPPVVPQPEPDEIYTEVGKVKRPPDYDPAKLPEPILVNNWALMPTEAELSRGFCFDFETTGVEATTAKIVGLAICTLEGAKVFYIPIGHGKYLEYWPFPESPVYGPQMDERDVLDYLAPLLGDSKVANLAHNAKYDINILESRGVPVRGLAFDSMVAAYLLRGPRGLSLDNLVREHLRKRILPISLLIGSKKSAQFNMSYVPEKDVARYAGAQVYLTLCLSQVLKRMLREQGMNDLFFRMELPLVPVLAQMERAGVLIDTDHLSNLGAILSERMTDIEKKLHRVWGEFETEKAFNVNSTQHRATLLFKYLGLPTLGRTPTGQPKTDASVLKRLQHGVSNWYLEHAAANKLMGTYVEAIPSQLRNGRIHTDFNQVVVATGRLSSSNPNLQNIPARSELGKEVRRAFVAPVGFTLMAADYSQVELRVLAHVSGEQKMIDAFLSGQDLHKATAAECYGVPYDDVPADKRSLAKNVNFSIAYGGTAYTIHFRYDVPLEIANEFLRRYFEKYTALKTYLAESVAIAKERGYAETIFGRRRYLPALKSEIDKEQLAAEREAMNHPIQGSAADILKLAMVNVARQLEGFKSRLLLQVHDELVLEVADEEAPLVEKIVRRCMEGAATLVVPLEVDIKLGKSWAECK